MTSNLTRKKIVALALIGLSSILLTGCASGKDAPTSQIKQVTDGVEADSGLVKVRDFLLVNQPDGSAVLVGTFINQGQSNDQLTGITVNGITAKLSAPSYELKQNQPIVFAGPSANAAGLIPGLKGQTGERYNAIINFQNAAPINVNAILESKSGYFANVSADTFNNAENKTK